MVVAVNVIALVNLLSILSHSVVLGQSESTISSSSNSVTESTASATASLSVSDATFSSVTTEILSSSTSASSGTSSSSTTSTSTASSAPTTGQSTGTTTPGTTTTTATPTGRSTIVPRNTDVGICTCDLTSNGCDVNCCCDSDCTMEDVAAFSACIDAYTPAEDRLCVQENIILLSNIANQSPRYSTYISDNLFCIQIDNYAQRNYYEVADKINTSKQFDEYLSTYGGPSFQSSQNIQTVFNQNYKRGTPLYTVYPNDVLGKLGLPMSLITKQCDDSNAAAYLIDERSDCVREVADISECETNFVSLNVNTYSSGFKIVASMDVLNGTISSTDPQPTSLYNSSSVISFSKIQCVDGAGTEVPCDQPSYNLAAGVCDNVVTQVDYSIIHNSTYIVSASVKLSLKAVTSKDFPLVQTYSIGYTKVGESNTFQRSGNPGYVIGQPVIAGKLVTQNVIEPIVYSIELPTDRNNYLNLVTSTATGDCETDTSKRVPVNFGENMRTGCLIRATLTNVSSQCAVIQGLAKIALLGNLNSSSYVATFGNSQPENVGDWIPVLGIEDFQNRAAGGDGGICNDISLGMHIEIVYINVGSLANPQPKIIGVNCKFDNPQRIQYRCIGPYCQPELQNMTQPFEVTSSVVFIDASNPAVTEVAAPPTVSAKLPADFWYPFYSNDGT